MSFFRSAVLISALYRVIKGEDSGDGLDTSAVFHIPADFGQRTAFNEIPNNLFSKEVSDNIFTYGRHFDDDMQATTQEPFNPPDSWSILWYFASFSGLIVFFLVVSCSEWCCRKHIRRSNSSQQTSSPPPSPTGSNVPEAPPPAYDLFAPPSYESLTSTSNQRNKEKSEYDVYVVPVHAIGSVLGAGASEVPEDAPPSYSAINMNFIPDQNTLEELRVDRRNIGSFNVHQNNIRLGNNGAHQHVVHDQSLNLPEDLSYGNFAIENSNINLADVINRNYVDSNNSNLTGTQNFNVDHRNFDIDHPNDARQQISRQTQIEPNQNSTNLNSEQAIPISNITENSSISEHLCNFIPAQNVEVTIIPTTNSIPDQNDVREVRTGNVAT